jgi:hypothetical protein
MKKDNRDWRKENAHYFYLANAILQIQYDAKFL